MSVAKIKMTANMIRELSDHLEEFQKQCQTLGPDFSAHIRLRLNSKIICHIHYEKPDIGKAYVEIEDTGDERA